MAQWLCSARTVQVEGVVSRFDPRFWTVDFPRPMMACVVSTAPDALRVDAVFYKADDLAGVIWAAEDRFDHPLLTYETSRDFRACRLRFRWRSGGVMALDAINGPTLTIEGRDAAGVARSWYVRLWNYAVGSPEDAVVSLDSVRWSAGSTCPRTAIRCGRGISTGCSCRWCRPTIRGWTWRWPRRARGGSSGPVSSARGGRGAGDRRCGRARARVPDRGRV